MALTIPRAAILAALGLAIAPISAQAIQLTNGDTADHVVEVYVGDAVERVTLKPGETKTGFCDKGCTLLMDDSALSELKGGEKVVIKGDQLTVETN